MVKQDAEEKRDSFRVACHLCGESFRRKTRCSFLAARVDSGELTNPYLVRFVKDEDVYGAVCSNPVCIGMLFPTPCLSSASSASQS